MSELVTVYITNYNYGRFIEQAIQSVLGQTYKKFELLIIDDGSNDGSHQIIERYRNLENVRIIYQNNKGLNASNNVAIENSNGKYLIRLDADDFFEPSALGVMISLLEADPELGLVFPDYYYVNNEGERTGQERRYHFDDEVTLYDLPAHGACTMIRLQFLKDVGGYDETFTCQDGYELWIKFISFYKVTNISKPLFSYRRHGQNLTGNEIRILNTRKAIKQKFVETYLQVPKTVAIIPIRSKSFDGVNWPFYIYQGKSILEHKVDSCLFSKNISKIVLVSAEEEILEYCKRVFMGNDRVEVLSRPEAYAANSVSLSSTIKLIINSFRDFDFENLMTISLDFPFSDEKIIDEAIHTQLIFKADSVISVKSDLSTYYQHDGSGLSPILDQDRYTKYERDALFKGAGGVVLSTFSHFSKTEKMVSNRIAHVLIDDKSSFGVMNSFDFKVFKALVVE